MSVHFADTLKKWRQEKGLTQKELADKINVTRSAFAKWENGNRMPDAAMISRLAEVLGVDAGLLLSTMTQNDERPNVMIVDDIKPIVLGALPVLKEVMPNAAVTGFTRASDVIEYAKANRVALAFLDIELGNTSGLDLCRTLLEINPHTNVVYLTAYKEYSFDAWDTGACGFLVKPLTPEGVRSQLQRLRYPFPTGGEGK